MQFRCNVACECRDLLFALIDDIGNQNASWRVLSDRCIVGLARARGMKATAVTCAEDETHGRQFSGSNWRRQMNGIFRCARVNDLDGRLGVTLAWPPKRCFFHDDTVIGRDTCDGTQCGLSGPVSQLKAGATYPCFFSSWKAATCRVAQPSGPTPVCALVRSCPKTSA